MKKIMLIIYIVIIFFIIRLSGAESSGVYEDNVKKALKRISASVVKVVTENHRRYIATGVAIDSNLVLSNIKVISHPFDRIYIETIGGKTYDVKIIGKDKNSSLLLLKTKKKVLKPVKRGELPEKGGWVGLVGVFYEQFPFLNRGIVSGISKNDLILNATVAPGSTGGAVINKEGEFVGIIRGVFGYKFFPQYTFKDRSSELKIVSSVRGGNDLCYALPVNRVFRIAKDLKKFGRVKRGWLGVSISNNRKGYVMVDRIVGKSPAELGGILEGDQIIEVDGEKIKTSLHLSESIKVIRPGEKVSLLLDRRGKEIKVIVRLEDMKMRRERLMEIEERARSGRSSRIPEFIESIPKVKNYVFEFSGTPTLGIDVIPLTPELATEFKVKSGNGLIVSKVKRKDKNRKLRVGDILITANKIKLVKTSDLALSLNKTKFDGIVEIKLIRKGKLISTRIIPSVSGSKIQVLDGFMKKFSNARFWMEKQQRLKMIAELKAIKLEEEAYKKEIKEKLFQGVKNVRKRNLEEEYKKKIERLMMELKKAEEELRRIEEKKKERSNVH